MRPDVVFEERKRRMRRGERGKETEMMMVSGGLRGPVKGRREWEKKQNKRWGSGCEAALSCTFRRLMNHRTRRQVH